MLVRIQYHLPNKQIRHCYCQKLDFSITSLYKEGLQCKVCSCLRSAGMGLTSWVGGTCTGRSLTLNELPLMLKKIRFLTYDYHL